ncbi:MAG: CorA family divalent cation transporter, partial [Nitrosopumilaceae archaeon]|nr:CorA family divalent cation transporter [Nitrosopumilaceae archaeon]
VQVIDTIEGLRDVVGGMLDTYLSSVSNKMNEIMKTLTIIASIFIPITFIAGIYGTNFEYIPELSWKGSYFVMLGVMLIVVIVMLGWFKKRNWL